MKPVIILALLLSTFATSAMGDDNPAFKVIEVQQTGGFAGVNISYRITPDGKFIRKSRRGTAGRNPGLDRRRSGQTPTRASTR